MEEDDIIQHTILYEEPVALDNTNDIIGAGIDIILAIVIILILWVLFRIKGDITNKKTNIHHNIKVDIKMPNEVIEVDSAPEEILEKKEEK